jgi:hypothetical protein
MQPNTTGREGKKGTPSTPMIDEVTFMAAWREQLHAVIGKPWLMRPWLARSSEFIQRVARQYEHLRQQPRHIRRRLQRQLGVSLAGAALALALVNSPAQAAPAMDALQPLPITANARINGSDCDLIDAIIAANTDTATGACNAGNPGADIITLLNNVTLTAINNNGADGENGLPVIESEITIEGSSFTISRDVGAPSFRIFEVASTGNLTLNQTTITGGDLASGRGGAILNAGALTVNNSTFTGNFGQYGGAIAGYAQQMIAAGDNASATPAVNDHGFGGKRALLTSEAIHNGLILLRSSESTNVALADSTITVSNSTFSGNSAKYDGGAIANYNVLTVSNSTFSGNSALLDGGAIDNNGVLTATNGTFSGNSAKYGGAIANGYFGDLTVSNCTLTGNQTNDVTPNAASSSAGDSSGGGIFSYGSLTLDRSLISGNTASNGAEVMQYIDQPLVTSSNNRIDALLAVTSNGNLFGHDGVSGVVGFAPDASDIVPNVGVAAILSGLANNGGDTQTHALIDGSPALDAAGDSGLATDQRGVRRPQGAADDIGAFELERCSVVTITIVKESMPPSATNFRFTSSILASGNRCQGHGQHGNAQRDGARRDQCHLHLPQRKGGRVDGAQVSREQRRLRPAGAGGLPEHLDDPGQDAITNQHAGVAGGHQRARQGQLQPQAGQLPGVRSDEERLDAEGAQSGGQRLPHADAAPRLSHPGRLWQLPEFELPGDDSRRGAQMRLLHLSPSPWRWMISTAGSSSGCSRRMGRLRRRWSRTRTDDNGLRVFLPVVVK